MHDLRSPRRDPKGLWLLTMDSSLAVGAGPCQRGIMVGVVRRESTVGRGDEDREEVPLPGAPGGVRIRGRDYVCAPSGFVMEREVRGFVVPRRLWGEVLDLRTSLAAIELAGGADEAAGSRIPLCRESAGRSTSRVDTVVRRRGRSMCCGWRGGLLTGCKAWRSMPALLWRI